MKVTSEKVKKNPTKEDETSTDNFESDRVSSLNVNCNIVSVLPQEYNQETEIEDQEEVDEEEMAKHKPVCYYVLNNGVV